MPPKRDRPKLDPDGPEGNAPRLTTRVPSALRDAATAEAERRGVTLSVAVREALALWLDTDPAAAAA